MRLQRLPLFGALVSLLASLVLVAPAAAAAPAARATWRVSVLASGLDNPRGIAVDENGRVFVAAAGRGGPMGYAPTGKILVIDRWGRLSTFAAGLPSAKSPEGEITGPTNIALPEDGTPVAIIGGGPQNVDPRFNSTVRLRTGQVTGNIQAFVNAHPDPTDLDRPPNPTDSNPYGAAGLDDAGVLVTDAANNTLLMVGPAGRVQMIAKFPNQVVSTSHLPPQMGLPPMLPAEAVPTTVAVGPDGYWYVGELKGFPFTPGASRIWRVAPWARNVTCSPTARSGACTLFMGGFTSITGLDFGPDGSLYVVEIVKSGVFGLFSGTSTTGALYRVRNGVRTEIAAGQLTVPDDVAVGRNGTIYVTNKSVFVGGGEVLAIRR
ncbi:MAG: ScyD/ScyE family protein [Chloroflexota bacterium]|nr:ScyD/ScyE family protein [Chloroflexota bacterium]